jgi:hypothetical protein
MRLTLTKSLYLLSKWQSNTAMPHQTLSTYDAEAGEVADDEYL